MTENGAEQVEDARDKSSGNVRKRGESLLQRIEHNWIEIAATALLALATTMSAISAYQSARWSSRESVLYNKSNEAMTSAAEYSDKANQLTTIDIQMLTNYMNALASGDQALANFYSTMTFSDVLKEALKVWNEQRAAGVKDMPRTPFHEPQYKHAERVKSDALHAQSQRDAAAAKKADDHADTYILLTVLFASVLFFAGMSTKFQSKVIKIVILGMGMVVFSFAVVAMAIVP
ncbi:MAG TPA: hypothetical protein VIK22_09900 [Candidatus Anoxymicrobiaceae bacterium]